MEKISKDEHSKSVRLGPAPGVVGMEEIEKEEDKAEVGVSINPASET